MPDYATLYLSRPVALADLQVCGCEPAATRADDGPATPLVAGSNETLATVRVAGAHVIVSVMPAAKRLAHLDGLVGYVRARLAHRDADVFERIDRVVQVLGLVVEPGFDPAGGVQAFIAALARRGAGFVFRNPDLVDPDGRPIARPVGEPRPPSDVAPAAVDDVDDDDDDDDDEVEVPPPGAARVLRRAWALACVAWRALAEMTDDVAETVKAVADVRAWVAQVGLDNELEDDERALLAVAPRELRGQQLVEASWRAEGLAVLAWSLGAYLLPDHETLCDPFQIFRAIGFMKPAAQTVAPPTLRPPDEIARQSRRLLGLHWRLRDFSLAPRATDLRALAAGKIWFGGFDLAGIALADDDLAIGGRPIVDADRALVRRCLSIAMERDQAIRWLEGAAAVYSEVDTST